ncbi:MAG: beta-lactamase family protein [Oscillospiraceae bacterium]|nr:beta-lactamase family protein [Oscillospiraceae bacterium]
MQKELRLPRAQTPEEVGISSNALAALMKDLIDSKLETHSVMVIRRGKVAYENFRPPFAPQYPHVMFSVSKTIAACAVGFAVSEGLLTVEDKVAQLLPELRGTAQDPYLEALTVEHLLTMTAGKEVSILCDKSKRQWLRDYANAKWGYAPGEGWNYSNENIYLLCVILHRLCGMRVVDYLMPRLFAPLGIPRPFWETDGTVEAGGWGLYLTTESFAKLVLCYTQGGVFQGKQVIPADWVQTSIRPRVQQNSPDADEHGNNGYGYCLWMNTVPNSCRADGMFSQQGYMFPEYDACVVTTGGEIFSSKTLDAFSRHLPGLFVREDAETPAQPSANITIPSLPAYPSLLRAPRNAALEAHLEGRFILFSASLQQLPKRIGYPVSVMPMAVFFMSADKAGGIDQVRFRFGNDSLKFSWSEGKERNTVLCGMDGRPRKCLITLGGVEFIVSCSAAWEGSQKLHVWIRPLNSVSERRLVFAFHGRQVRMLPRSNPSLRVIGEYIAPYCTTMIPNPVLGGLLANTMAQVAIVAEPMHFGYLMPAYAAG